MKTVTKALSLMQQFVICAEPKPLGAIASQAGLNKATTRRMLLSLCGLGLIEQDPITRDYALGPAVLPLARAREKQRPLTSIIQPIIRDISSQIGETTHFSVHAQKAMSVFCVAESEKSIRAHISEGSLLPLHTTGAGIAYLSARDDAFVARVTASALPGTTAYSYTTAKQVMSAVKKARQLGYSMTEQTFEEDLCGISVPVFRNNDACVGVIGVATPAQRMNADAKDRIVTCLRQSARELLASL